MSGFDVRNSLFVDGGFAPGSGRLRGYAPPPDAAGRAVHFAANSVGMYRTSALSGVSDSSKGTISYWYRLAETPYSTGHRLLVLNNSLNGDGLPDSTDPGTYFYAQSAASTGPFAFLWDGTASNTTTFQGSMTQDAEWHHIAMAWDTDFAAGSRTRQMVIDGGPIVITSVNDVGAAFNVDLDKPGGCSINNTGFFGTTWVGPITAIEMAELYVNFAEHVDLSRLSNIAKLRNPVTGKPVYLGTDGALLTGTAPAIYLRVDGGAEASSFATNRGTGGNFTITGSLALAATGPY